MWSVGSPSIHPDERGVESLHFGQTACPSGLVFLNTYHAGRMQTRQQFGTRRRTGAANTPRVELAVHLGRLERLLPTEQTNNQKDKQSFAPTTRIINVHCTLRRFLVVICTCIKALTSKQPSGSSRQPPRMRRTTNASKNVPRYPLRVLSYTLTVLSSIEHEFSNKTTVEPTATNSQTANRPGRTKLIATRRS